jgi:hypothetical protein
VCDADGRRKHLLGPVISSDRADNRGDRAVVGRLGDAMAILRAMIAVLREGMGLLRGVIAPL